MEIKKMFMKEIDRPIRGVIKIGNEEESVTQELDEYVVTNELHNHLGDFFAAYKKGIIGQTDEVGIWISGFFGSGKSHFLKILSYLTKNDTINGRDAISYLEDKIQDSLILDNMQLANHSTKDVILFDIDAKSESDAKNDKNAIVNVMNKAFNEMQGYCGAIPWIADMERQMDKDGIYEQYKENFKQISGAVWEETREDFYYEEDAIIESLCKTTKMSEESARNWFQRAEQDYTISIERFAKRVNEYIESKGDNHHVLFFIDEIGQYIGEDSQLMLNLQTIVHEFGLKSKGKAWVIVTSQEDYDSFMTVRGNDFSKIQGRFDTKLSLSSAYVDEVITKRLLLKNDYGKETLEEVYQKSSSVINNLLTFSNNSAEMKKYSSLNEFIDVYPFVPYQFHLLQQSITEIANHSNSSKHQSRGERSLLSAFQEAAICYSNQEEGALVPFSTFYEPMEKFLETSTTRVMIRAENNTRLDDYDVKILKLLYLIKYVKELPATLENIATLMVENINEDKVELKKKIENSLSRLIRETLIQKNGDDYIFLTNDEQDVNREIKNMPVDSAEVIHKIGDVLLGAIYTDKKFRYSKKYDFGFHTIIDDRPIDTTHHDIGLRLITPYADGESDHSTAGLKMMSMRENNVILKLPQDTSYLDEMEEILRIQAYIKRKSGISLSQTVEDIKTRKSREVTERKFRVATYLQEALKAADIYANSQKLDIKGKNPVDRINEAFRSLINNLYNKLNYVKVFIDSPKQLEDILKETITQLTIEGTEDPNQLAMKELETYIGRLTSRNQTASIRSIVSHFGKQPYGWNDLDTTGLLIRLFKTQEVKLMLNSSYIHNGDPSLFQYFTKRDYVDRVIVKKRERISPILMQNLKNLSQDLFDISSLPTDEDGMMKRFKELLQQEQHTIERLFMHYKKRHYPGQPILEDGRKLLAQLADLQDAAAFYNKAREVRQLLKDYAANVKEVKGFFENQQEKYDQAVKRLEIFDSNRTYVNDEDMLTTISEIEKIVHHTSPYSNIQKLPGLCQAFDERFVALLSIECEPIQQIIEQDLAVVIEELEKDPVLMTKFAAVFRNQFISLKERLDRVNNFYEAIAMQTESDRLKVKCMDAIQKEFVPLIPVSIEEDNKTPIGTGGSTIIEQPRVYKKTKTLSKQAILRGTKRIETIEDLDALLLDIRKKIENELDENTIITLV